MPDKIIAEEPAAAHVLREMAEGGDHGHEYRVRMEAMMQRQGILPAPHHEEARISDAVMKAAMMPPKPPKPDNIRIKKDFIVESITVRGATAQGAMPELRRKIAAAFGDTIKYCEQEKAAHEKRTGRTVKDVNLDLTNIIRDLTVLSDGNETDEEIDELVAWTVYGTMEDFRRLSTPVINGGDNKLLRQANVMAPMQVQGVTPTYDTDATEQYSDKPHKLMTLPVNTPADDHTSTPEAIIQAYLHQAKDNELPAYQRNAPASSMGTNPLLALTPEERELHEQARDQLMADEGYLPDGSKTFLKELSESKTMEGLQNNIVLPAIQIANFVDGAGEIKEIFEEAFVTDAIKETTAVAITTPGTKKGWSVGESINNLTAKGDVPAWSTVRQRYWKNKAFFNSGNYTETNILRMQRGLAPQRFNKVTGLMESMELHHHIVPQRDGGLFDFIEVWPDEHKKLDSFRK